MDTRDRTILRLAVPPLATLAIEASDTRAQQWGNVIAFAVFAPWAAAVLRWGGGIIAIWCGLGAWMLARLAVNAWRFRGSHWTTVAGAISSLPLPDSAGPKRGSTDN